MASKSSVGPKRVRVVTLIDFYVPGFRAGGPVKSIVNLISMLGDEFKFEVLTSDRDLGMDEPYKDILTNSPRKVGRGVVFYCSRSLSGLFFVIRRLSVKDSKIFYFNSFFSSRFSIFPFLFLSTRSSPRRPRPPRR